MRAAGRAAGALYQKARLSCETICHAPEKHIARQPCGLSRHARQTFNSLPNANYRTKLAFTSELLRLVSEATASFGLGLASLAANTRQGSGKKAGGDIDFAAFYILPVPSSLSAKWRRVKIGSLPSFSPSRRMPPKHPPPLPRKPLLTESVSILAAFQNFPAQHRAVL